LNRISDSVYVLEGAVNIGVLVKGKEAIVVDTGLGDTGARKVRRWLENNGLLPIAIINTHSHADHFGGNAFLLKRFEDIRVYAPEIEDAFVRYPLLEPAFLYGAYPPDELITDFLVSEASPVHEILKPGSLKIGGFDIEIVPLPGHSFNQMGVVFENVFFAADSLFVPELIEKYRILFFVDYNMWIETLNKLKEFKGYTVIPGHRKFDTSIDAIVERNLLHLEEIKKLVTSCMPDPFDCVFNKLGIPENPVSRALAGTSIRAVMKTVR